MKRGNNLLFHVVLWVALAAIDNVSALAASSRSCAREAAWLKSSLSSYLRLAAPSETINPFLAHYPLPATLGMHIYQHDRDVAFLKEVHAGTAKHLNVLLSGHDRDGDFLLERSTHTGGSSDVEDVAFNTMVAIDMLSLAAVCSELHAAIDALYWYQGAKTVRQQIIAQTYDAKSGFFLPTNNSFGGRDEKRYALSLLPAADKSFLGDNVIDDVLQNHLLSESGSYINAPRDFLDPETLTLDPEQLLTTNLLLAMLEGAGLQHEAAEIQRTLQPRFPKPLRHDQLGSDGEYFACMLRNRGYESLLPRHTALDVFAGLSSLWGVMEEKDIARMNQSVPTIKRFLMSSRDKDADVPDPTLVEQSIRSVYWTISSLRRKAELRNLFTSRDRNKIPGFDIYVAYDQVVADVLSVLQETDTRLSEFRTAKNGFTIKASLLKARLFPGEPADIRLEVSSTLRPVALRSLTLVNGPSVDTLFAEHPPAEIKPEDPPHEFWFRVALPNARESTLNPIEFLIEAVLDDGRRLKYYMSQGVYVQSRVGYAVSFPRGRTLRGESVPIRVQIEKNVRERIVLNSRWYSPSGLTPKDGRNFEVVLPANLGSASIELDVVVPKDMRPGEFPFTLALFANGADVGTVSSKLFKHYQWVYLGPFAQEDDPLSFAYPPETSVNLQQSYAGAIKSISWTPVPVTAHRDNGEVDLTSLLPEESVGYLYTVIEAQWSKHTTLAFSSPCPAVIFVNGEEVFRQSTGTGATQRISVGLQSGLNNFLVKLLSSHNENVFFQLGDEEDLMPDEFNNELTEIVDGYGEFLSGDDTDADAQRVVTIRYENSGAASVAVIGSFNAWSPVVSKMRSVKPGLWEISLHLQPGRYAYRFLVDNNVQVLDPKSQMSEPDGYGGQNSVLLVR